MLLQGIHHRISQRDVFLSDSGAHTIAPVQTGYVYPSTSYFLREHDSAPEATSKGA